MAAWATPLAALGAGAGGVGGAIGYIGLASGVNHALSASAPFTGATQPVLNYVGGRYATTALDTAALGSGLAYSSVKVGQAGLTAWNARNAVAAESEDRRAIGPPFGG